MATYGTYHTLADLKTAIGLSISDTADDLQLKRVLEHASRLIDDWCGRHFYAYSRTRYYTARHGGYLLLTDDLLSITTLKTDSAGDRTYGQTWTATDYDLLPFNEFPKWRIETAPNGSYLFPTGSRGIEITGLWGYGDGESATPYVASGATITVDTTTGATATASAGTAFAIGQTLLVGTEQMYVASIAGNNVTVVRGVNGTTAAIHAAVAASIYRYPGPVVEACQMIAHKLFRRKDAPFGVVGSGEVGTFRITANDRQITDALGPYRRIGFA